MDLQSEHENKSIRADWESNIICVQSCELHEGESLWDHILEMMAYMNQLEYIDSSFDRNHAVDLLLDSTPYSYIDFL